MAMCKLNNFIIDITDDSDDSVPDETMRDRLSTILADGIADNDDFMGHFSGNGDHFDDVNRCMRRNISNEGRIYSPVFPREKNY